MKAIIQLLLLAAIGGAIYLSCRDSFTGAGGAKDGPPPRQSRPTPTDGAVGIFAGSKQLVPVGGSRDAVARFHQLQKAGDTFGADQMMSAGEVVGLPNGTRGRIIDAGWEFCEVRVESGDYAGNAVFVSSSLFKVE
jgi:hypothetical protein